jgi:hypothetical protein
MCFRKEPSIHEYFLERKMFHTPTFYEWSDFEPTSR